MKRTVLVVDDEKGYREMYAYLLAPLGIEVACVENGREAIEEIRRNAYGLVLMDVHMPVLTGPEAYSEIKKIRPEQKVVIFSSSSDPSFDAEHRAINEGVMDCLYKPVSLEELEKVINQVFPPASPISG